MRFWWKPEDLAGHSNPDETRVTDGDDTVYRLTVVADSGDKAAYKTLIDADVHRDKGFTGIVPMRVLFLKPVAWVIDYHNGDAKCPCSFVYTSAEFEVELAFYPDYAFAGKRSRGNPREGYTIV